jgi:hypothetical protein
MRASSTEVHAPRPNVPAARTAIMDFLIDNLPFRS